MNFFCRIGFHVWEKWTQRQAQFFNTFAGMRIGEAFVGTVQRRVCKKCGVEEREVIV